MGKKQLTTEEFIRRAKEIHGDKYDYSKTEYVNANTKVCIICPKHGEFWQLPSNHTHGTHPQGCPKCNAERPSSRRLTTEEFIKKAREIHGDKYDYSNVEYVNASTKVCIICPEHGEFWQTPGNHIFTSKPQGCPKCAGRITMTTEEFINKAREVHGDKYDYSKVKYVNATTKVCIINEDGREFWQLPSNHLKGFKPLIHMTTEEFIKKAREVHGDKYDYSKVEYVGTNTKVCLICPEHGEFWQIPLSHLQGCGCPKCANNVQLTADDFIRKAREIHGDKYDYSKVRYISTNKKVCIICPEHGEFWQTPSNHLSGKGCAKCANNVQLTTEEFIRKAREVHGDKYDYSKVEYVNANTKVCIICPKHGEFWQTLGQHIRQKQGCPKCGMESMLNWQKNRKMTTEEFISRAKEVHGDKYDYSKVKYTSYSAKVCIICPEHGEFWQTPGQHLSGKGCVKCAGNVQLTTEEFIRRAKEVHGDKYDYSKTKYINNHTKVCIINEDGKEIWQLPSNHLKGFKGLIRMTTEEFIKKAREVHGDKYDYSKVEYNGTHTKVCIICQEHGEFWQEAKSHLYGASCPRCLGFNKTTEEFIGELKDKYGDKYDYSKVEYVNATTKVCIICPEHGEFFATPNSLLSGHECPNCSGIRKQYKFNLLQEFKNEYSFKSFLENNDENILYVILRNIEPKYDPIKKDIEKALDRSFNENPIKALEEKYSSDSDDEIDDDESWAESETEEAPVIDLDDDEAVEAMLSSDGDAEVVQAEPTIEDLIKNTEKEIKVINKIEHLLTPEDREYIMEKFLNDKRRAWMLKREERV